LDNVSRQGLVQALLDDLKTCCTGNGNQSRLVINDAAKALLAVKTLGKMPIGSEVVATSANLSTLLALSTSLKNDPQAINEALRCVANALLLIETARMTWVGEQVGGGEACIDFLEKSTTPDQIFLASRILFLCTVSSASGTFIQTLVEVQHTGSSGTAIDIIGAKLDLLITCIVTGAKMAREAMTDILKFTFNLLVHYPKMVDCEVQDPNFKGKAKNITNDTVMGDYWSPKLAPILPPLIRVFNSLPASFPAPLASPLAEVIHSMITIPFSTSLRPVWFGQEFGTPYPPSGSNRTYSSSDTSSGTARSESPISGTAKEKPGPMDRALSVLAASRRSFSRSGSQSPTTASNKDIILRVHDLLEVSMSHYLPGDIDPDDASIKETCQKEGDSSLDDILSPLVVLMTRIAHADHDCRVRTREWLLPADLDRTRRLESRADLLGRCLRLLGSVHHSRLKDAVGEMLFAICDSDATTLSAQVGYGNVAGYLFNKGVMNAPTQPSNATLTTPSGAPINPITGTLQAEPVPSDMTEEEKEREAEKLFVLFDRLEKSGVLPPSQNPIRKAAAEGRLG
jgi:hypothetical protein